MGFVGRKPTNAPLTSDDIPNGIISAADLASGISGLITWQSVQTTGFTAVAGRGYPCNTTSAAFTVTLPASPSVGDTIILLDYAGTFDTNILTLAPNGNKINGSTDNRVLNTEREAVNLTYVDSTQGWLASSAVNEGTVSLSPEPYSVDFLVVAGGAAGGTGGGSEPGGGGGAGGYRTSTQSVATGTVITVTVGDGGPSGNPSSANGNSGANSSISGSGLTTITSAGGGGGAGGAASIGASGGSGGGAAGIIAIYAGGSGNTPSTSPSQGNNGGSGLPGSDWAGGGGGGAGAVGQNGGTRGSQYGGLGGNGTASSITGSSVTYAGGGGGGGWSGGDNAAGGTGGGGTGGRQSGTATGTNGTANLGGGGGGAVASSTAGSGGKGVVILSVPTAKYSATSTGSPTITTSGSNTILKFTGSGTYTA